MTTMDATSRRWIEHLHDGHPGRDPAIGLLHDVLRRAATHEMARRRHELWSITGPEFDDLAEQAADDAMITILGKLDEFRGLSRFTTWAYAFVIFEVSAKVARHRWRRQPPGLVEPTAEAFADRLALGPEEKLEQADRLAALSRAIDELTDRQREVFVAIALNDVPIDVVALRLGANRNAIYKNLFDARRNLRQSLTEAGLPIGEATAGEPVGDAGEK